MGNYWKLITLKQLTFNYICYITFLVYVSNDPLIFLLAYYYHFFTLLVQIIRTVETLLIILLYFCMFSCFCYFNNKFCSLLFIVFLYYSLYFCRNSSIINEGISYNLLYFILWCFISYFSTLLIKLEHAPIGNFIFSFPHFISLFKTIIGKLLFRSMLFSRNCIFS